MNLCAKVRRRIRGGAKEVTQPHLIILYNKNMGGVNLMDRLLESYRPIIHGKMVLDHVRKFSQRYSRCIMENILPTWPPKDISPGVLKTLCLLKTEEEPKNRLDGEAEHSQDLRFDKINHFRRLKLLENIV